MEVEPVRAREDFGHLGRPNGGGHRHLDDLADHLEPVSVLAAAAKGRRRSGQANGGGSHRGAPKTVLEEEEEDDEVGDIGDPELEALANGDDVGIAHSPRAKDDIALSHLQSQARQMRKAKHHRLGRAHSISEEGRYGSTHAGAGGAALSASAVASAGGAGKNSRKSRSGMGRGLPKKGGAGGKGTWGKLGCELELPWVDPNDPNYESDSAEAAPEGQTGGVGGKKKGSSGSVGGGTKLKALVPEMSEEDVRKAVEQLVLEYFENSDASEVIFSLQEMLMNLGARRWMIVSILVELAMDHKPSHRELASELISDLYLKVVSQRDIGRAFDALLSQLPDLTLDAPDAPAILGNFMARAVADDCIPPRFIQNYKGHVANEQATTALRKADTLLSMKHGLVRLDNVWGVGGGVRPTKYLTKKIVLLLKEYLCSGDIQEATLCLKELEVPHFHHELVYEAVIMVIESMHEKTEVAMCKLLQSLFRSFVITMDQMKNGFERAYDFMPEISIDVPAAYGILERFVTRCRADGILTDELVRKMPSRGRKRFVSEGDGGRVKF